MVQACPSLCACTIGVDSHCLQLVASLQHVPSHQLHCLLRHPSSLVSHPSCFCHHPLALLIALDASYSPPGLVFQLNMFVIVITRFTSRAFLITVGITRYDHFAARLAPCSCVLTSCTQPLCVIALLGFVSGTFDWTRVVVEGLGVLQVCPRHPLRYADQLGDQYQMY